MSWYEGLTCSACGKALDATRRQGRPLLRSASGATVEPHRFSAEDVAALRDTHVPICWACNLAAAFQPVENGGSAAAPAARRDPNWWVGFPCDVCATPLKRGWFWQERPRVVDQDVRSCDVRTVERASCEGPSKRYVVTCTDCYYNAYGRVKASVTSLLAAAGAASA